MTPEETKLLDACTGLHAKLEPFIASTKDRLLMLEQRITAPRGAPRAAWEAAPN